MRVLHVCSYYASPLYRLLFDALGQKGIEQEVFYFAARGTKYEAQEEDVCFSCCYNNFDRLFFMHKERKAADALYRNIDVASFDVLHAHSLFTNGFLALDAKRRFGIPYIVAVRNTDLNSFFKVRPWLKRTGIEIMQEAAAIVFLSPAYKRRVIDQIVPEDMRDAISRKCFIIPNGINEVFFENPPSASRKSDGVLRVIQVGDINRNKNQLTVAKACKAIEKSGERISYTAIGKVKDKRLASRLAKFDCVRILQPMSQDRLIQAYRSADVFVMPSIHETFGLTYVEAMSQGLPVIYTAGEGFDGWIKDNQLGKKVDPGNSAAIVEAILELAKLRFKTFSSVVKFSKMFRWPDIASTYIDTYRQLVV